MIGTTLSHFHIIEKIGEGGMGEVYRAEDTRLHREVAIKFLPEVFTEDPERLARFEREAQLLASLNHQNIAGIYGLEEAQGKLFLVLELVEGETLADRLSKGQMGTEEALKTTRQITEGLAAAHEKGIVHRDLKPANVKLTADALVKILDFGLAKAWTPDSTDPDLTLSPTLTGQVTQPGVILGTAAYMSPEQARGQGVDKQTDIWACGCLLYEMLTGRPAFPGATVSDTIAAILEREPAPDPTLDSAAPALRRLLSRCLSKDPTKRLHDIADVRIEIDTALTEPSSTSTTVLADRHQGLSSRLIAGLVLVGLVVGAVGAWLLSLARDTEEVSQLEIESVARLTHDPGLSEWPTWSPDGSLLAFASDRSGDFEIYVRRIEGGREVNITSDPGEDFQPSFSPDGDWIAFVSTRSSRSGMIKIGATFGFEFRTFGGDLWLAPALGGRARRLASDANFPSWHPDGQRVAVVSGPEDHRSILEVDVETGTSRALLESEASRWEIVRLQYSPDGDWLSFEALGPERVYVVPSAGGEPRQLLTGVSHVWDGSSGGLLYLTRDPGGGTRVQWMEMDSSKGEPVGNAQTLGLMTGILRDLAIQRDGRLLALTELDGALNLTRLPLSPEGGEPAGPEEELSSGQVIDRYPRYSEDGKRIAFASDRLGAEEIWILDLESGRQERLDLPGEDLGANLPYWSPDGRQLSVTRFYPEGTRSIWLAAVDGSHAEQLLPPSEGLQGGPVFPDGNRILYSAKHDGIRQLFSLDLSTGESTQISSTPGDKYAQTVSPDGKWIAYAADLNNSLQVWRMPTSGGEGEVLTTGNERIRHAIYSPDGKWLYVQPSHGNIYRLPASGGELEAVTTFPGGGLFLEEPSLSPDGRYLAYCRSNGGSSLWLLTLAPTDG